MKPFILRVKKRVLVLSPDLINANRIALQLSYEHYHVHYLHDCWQLLETVKENNYDIIISHLSILQSDHCFRALKELKTHKKIPNIPVILFSEKKTIPRLDVISMRHNLEEYGIHEIISASLSTAEVDQVIQRSLLRFNQQDSLEYKFTQGKKAFINRQLDKSRDFFKEISDAKPFYARANMGLAYVYQVLGDDEKMNFYLDRAVHSDENHLSVNYLQFEVAVKSKNLKKMARLPERLINNSGTKDALNATILIHLATILYKFANPHKVLDLLNTFVVYLKDLPNALIILRCRCLVKVKKLDEAQNQIDLLYLKESKEISEAHILKAIIFRLKGKFAKALVCYQTALEYTPQNERLLYNISLTYLFLNQKLEAENHLRNLLRINPSHEKASLLAHRYGLLDKAG